MKLRWILPFITTIMITAMIFILSSQTADDSAALSRGLTTKVINVLPSTKDLTREQKTTLVAKIHSRVRKSAHFTIFLLAGFSSAAMFYRIFGPKRLMLVLFSAIVFCILYASSDEIHQHFISGRGMELRDVIIDSCGASLGAVIYIMKKLLIGRDRRIDRTYM